MFVIASCKKETTKSKNTSETTTVIKDTLSTKLKNSIIDLDPTDTIPAGRYGINSSSLKTTNIVRLTLQNIFKEDLPKNSIDDYNKRFLFFEYDLNNDYKKYPSNPSLQPELKVTPGDNLPRALNHIDEPYAWFKF